MKWIRNAVNYDLLTQQVRKKDEVATQGTKITVSEHFTTESEE